MKLSCHQYVCALFLVLTLGIAAASFVGCAGSSSSASAPATEEPVKIQVSALQRIVNDHNKDLALQHFIEGSLQESKGDYAQAILEYQDALRFDQDPALYYALAKNYSLLRKHDLAAENGKEAVRRDSLNITYRETLAGIYLNAGKLDEAAEEFSNILAIDSNHTQSAYALAQLTERKNPARALDLYERILQRSGPSWEVLLRVGELSAAFQRFDRAIDAFTQLKKLDPDNPALARSIAELYFNAEKYDSAQILYRELIAKNPGDIELHGALAEVYTRQGQWPKAEKEYDVILRSDSLTADTRFKVASAYYAQTQKDTTLVAKTIAQFKSFLKAYPNDWRPLLYLGVLSRVQKDYPEAKRYLDAAVKSASWNPEAWWQLGWLYFEQDKISDAISSMERAREALPNEFRIQLLLGICYSRAQRNMDAVVALEHAIEIEPNDVNALSSLGLAYDALKNFQKSDSTYERALKIDPHYSLVLNNYAYSLSERGVQLERALDMAREALAKDSLNASYLDTYGWIQYKLGNYADARRYIQKAIDAGDSSAAVLEHMGDACSRLEQKDSAMKFWKRALELDTANPALRQKVERGTL
ncbi:MAG TPA: tetratricopeptide repeat protein [Bacteroidota bacterium]|nr:tetratricopeptide repeat protein [Bacteroidota bacterium]